MKPLAILALAIALEVGFLLTAALPAPTLARFRAGRRVAVVTARAVAPAPAPAPARS